MFETEVMKEFRQTHDCRDMDIMGLKPLFVFRILERVNKEWKEFEGDFYADTPLEALDQAHDEGIYGVENLLQARCIGACNYFYDRGEAHAIFTFDLVQAIAGKFQSINPPSDIFRKRVIKRRKEMKEEGIL